MFQDRTKVVGALMETGVVAVVRADDATGLTALADALRAGGVMHTEITMTVPGALASIEAAVRDLGGDSYVGAGTVLDPTTARRAIEAGAAFIVSPSFEPNVVTMAHRYGVAVIPGCLTPSEISCAWSSGADILKLFPGRVATPGYFADLRGPFPQVKLMPTGNVDLETTPQYIAAGAVAVGVGKALVDPSALREARWPEITERARRFRGAVMEAREA